MNFYQLVLQNLMNLPLFCFIVGVGLSWFNPSLKLPLLVKKSLTIAILFSIGLKGGGPLIEHSGSNSSTFMLMSLSLILWAMIQPVFSYFILKAFTSVDKLTAAAIAACFGSISVVTFITAVSFLDQVQTTYQGFVIAAIAIMDVPAIISGILIAKKADKTEEKTSFFKLLKDSLLNKAVISILSGLCIGALLSVTDNSSLTNHILNYFKPLLAVFLLDMGLSVGQKRYDLKSFSFSLSLFGMYMPLLSSLFGLLLSYLLKLDPGTGTLICVLCASASYIAVPAAMKVALPKAKEALYIPLSLAMAFPFNIVIGIPLYYYLACTLLQS